MLDYIKYKWFFTRSEKLVVGGKSAEQNDSLLKDLKKSNKDYIIMHTSSPGSPFSVIVSDIKEISKSDLKECAIFTACFSQAWKKGKDKEEVHIFRLSQINKEPGMKQGTWGVLGKVSKLKVSLKLALTIQKNKLRAVPEETTDNPLLSIKPGKKDKLLLLKEIRERLNNKLTDQEIISAVPAGGISIK